jgi:hypothetical protein
MEICGAHVSSDFRPKRSYGMGLSVCLDVSASTAALVKPYMYVCLNEIKEAGWNANWKRKRSELL